MMKRDEPRNIEVVVGDEELYLANNSQRPFDSYSQLTSGTKKEVSVVSDTYTAGLCYDCSKAQVILLVLTSTNNSRL